MQPSVAFLYGMRTEMLNVKPDDASRHTRFANGTILHEDSPLNLYHNPENSAHSARAAAFGRIGGISRQTWGYGTGLLIVLIATPR